MKRYLPRMLPIVIGALFILPRLAFAQCTWVTTSVLYGVATTVDQPGLTSFSGKLYLAFVGEDSNRTVNVVSSTNGVSWGNKVILTAMRSSYGVGIVGGSGCNALYLGFVGRDSDRTMNISKSTNGTSWSAQKQFSGFNQVTHNPAFLGTTAGVGIGYRKSSGVGASRTFDCNVLSASAEGNFFSPAGNCAPEVDPYCNEQTSGSPALADANVGGGLAQIRALGRSYTCTFGSCRGIIHQNNFGAILKLGGHWTDWGVSATVDTDTNFRYMIWRGGDKRFNIARVNQNGDLQAHKICSDWSNSDPSIASFQNKLFVAWRGGNNVIQVSSMYVF